MIAGVDKLNSYLSRCPNKVLKLRSRVTLLVFDEAHQSIAPTYKELLDMFLSRPINPPSLLGLSATPGRTWRDREEDLRLAEFYQQNKVTLEVEGYENPVTYLIDKGYLAKPTFIQLSNESILEQNSIATNVLEIPNDLLKKLGDDTKRNVIIIKRLQELIQNHQRVMYFAPSVANAKTISRTLVAMGVDSMVVTGETPSSVRQKSILKFKSDANSPMIICNFGVLTTGFDAPRTSAALIARPTLSLVLYSQMVGRAIRGPLAGGNKNATIVTVIDSNLPGFRKVEEAFMNWEQVWQYQENERQE
jgi:superfamily II DNA or RNA helicase